MKGGGLWLALTLLPALIGVPLLSHPTFERYGFFGRAALSAGVGTVLLSLVMTTAALVPVPWGVAWLTGASLVLALLLRPLLGQEAEGPRPPGGGSRAVVLGAAAVSAGAVGAALFATYAGATASTDLFHFWGPKAEAFASARTIDAEFLRAAWHDHLHPDYPPLVTNLFAFASLGIGRLPWGTAPYTYPMVLAGLALALTALLASDRPQADGCAVAALVIAETALLGNTFLVGGAGDIYLVFFGIASVAILSGPDAGRGSRLLLSGLLLAGAASAKVEGLVLAVAAAALFLLVTPRRALCAPPASSSGRPPSASGSGSRSAGPGSSLASIVDTAASQSSTRKTWGSSCGPSAASSSRRPGGFLSSFRSSCCLWPVRARACSCRSVWPRSSSRSTSSPTSMPGSSCGTG